MIASTGWTWDYIDDRMTLNRLKAMNAYWKQYPPIHMLLAMKWLDRTKTAAPKDNKKAQQEFLSAL